MNNFIYTLIILTLPLLSYSQNINMSNGSSTACSGNFYDSGGSGGSYNSNENFVYTICAPAGSEVQVAFSSFFTESTYDYLYIYDGNSTSATSLGSFTGSTSPGTVVSSGGCLTFEFISDGSYTDSGWEATISCLENPFINIGNGSTTACSGTFFDSGGPTSNYTNNENYTYTICPSTPGSSVQIDFTSFHLEDSYDFLQVFDGNSTSAPSLGTYTGTTGPGLTVATPSNSSGCLTFVFTSDGSTRRPGWTGAVSCTTYCQTINSNLQSSAPAADPVDGVIRLCQGQALSVTGGGTFSNTSAGATYTWDMGDGTTLTGTTVNHTYSAIGSYLINVTITDANGCTNNNVLDQEIQISTTPTFAAAAAPSVFCEGNSSNLSCTPTPTPFGNNCTPPVSGTTFLPDGSGVSYTTSIPVSCYLPGETITSASDITNICLNMEHSYLGDLEIAIECPNGQRAVLKSYANDGAGLYLGEADDLSTAPGVGYTYCFTSTATTLLVNGPTTNVGNPASASINPGNYMPTEPFTNLIGCPANGNWTIHVTDNLSSDDGYIFNWDIDLTNTLLGSGSYTPTITTQGWAADPDLTTLTGTTASITPSTSGAPCYYYEVVDNFGCTYRDTTCVTVTPASTAPSFTPMPGTYCPNTSVTLNAGGGTASPGSTIEWYDGANGSGNWLGSGSTLTVSPTATSTYYVRREGGCNTSADDQVTINLKDFIYGLNGATTSNYCTDNAGWHHFYQGNEILLSIQGDISGAPAGYPEITIWKNNTWYQQTQGPGTPASCIAGTLTPGEERFEMSRSWNVDFGGGTLNPPYNVRFYHRPAERAAVENAINNHIATHTACGYTYKYANPNGFYWFKNTGSNYTAPDYDGLHLTAATGMTSNSINYAELTGVTSFSGGGGGAIAIPTIILPVTWLYFNGETDTKVNYLNWATESEQNSSVFNIQRSVDGVNFETIGSVAAQGNSTTTHHYTFDDENPFKGINYYRLALVDLDGSVTYSKTIQLVIPEDNLGYTFYPNPTYDVVNYQYEASSKEPLELEIIDVYGRTLMTQKVTTEIGLNKIPVNLSDYPVGSYLVRVKHLNSSNVHTTKVIKSEF